MKKGLTTIFALLVLVASNIGFAESELNFTKLIKSNWTIVETDNFTILSDLKPKYIKNLALELEEFRYFIHFKAKLTPLAGDKKLKIFAPGKEASMEALGLNKEIAGLFSANEFVTFAVANVIGYKGGSKLESSSVATLFHEYVHYAVERSIDSNNYPLWYSEGLAEYYATFRKYKSEIRLGEPDRFIYRFFDLLPQHAVKKHFFEGSTGSRYRPKGINSEELFKAKNYDSIIEDEAVDSISDRASYLRRRFYARAISVTHYLHGDSGKQSALKRYLDYVSWGVPEDISFQASFGITFEQLDDLVEEYINGRSVKGWVYNIGEDFTFPNFKITEKKLAKGTFDSRYLPLIARLSKASASPEDLLKYIDEVGDPEAFYAKYLLKKPSLLDATSKGHVAAFNGLMQDQMRFPGSADLAALLGASYLSKAKLYSSVYKHSQGNLYKKASELFAIALKLDSYNSLAYSGLGSLSSINIDDKRFYKQGLVAYESLLSLTIDSHSTKYLLKKAKLEARNSDFDAALTTMRAYSRLSDSYFAKMRGKLIYNGLEMWTICREAPEKAGQNLVWRNGSTYSGEVINGLPDGKGVLNHVQGFIVEGIWSGGKVVQGKIISDNGFSYSGQFDNCVISGYGVMSYPHAEGRIEKIEGEFLAGWSNGSLALHHRNGTIESGSFVMGSPEGEFVIKKPSGHSFSVNRSDLGYEMTLPGGETWFGPVDSQFRPNGEGVCLNSEKLITSCTYKHGEVGKPNLDP